MFKRFLYGCLFALLILATVLVFNTWRYTKPIPSYPAVAITGISDSAAIHLGEAIRIKTISFGDTLPVDTTEFNKFRSFLETTYPTVHRQLPRMIFSEFSYIYTWKGKDSTLQPLVIMAHMDVVPVEAVAEKKWSVPSFSGLIKEDTVWGRGAVDDKASAVAFSVCSPCSNAVPTKSTGLIASAR